MCVFTTMFFLPSVKKEGSLLVFLLFIAGFWLIGLGMLAGAVNLGRRTAKLSVDLGRLHVEINGLFGRKERVWSRDEIAAVCAGPSGMEVNDRPVIELQIHPVGGKKVGFLGGRDEPELRWMAAQLRRSLKVPARPAVSAKK